MIREQCEYCGRYSYRDGRCYADRKLKGIPISEILYCGWATPPYELPGKILKKPRPDESRRGGQNTVLWAIRGKKTRQR